LLTYEPTWGYFVFGIRDAVKELGGNKIAPAHK
jgi:hypothetical protein